MSSSYSNSNIVKVGIFVEKDSDSDVGTPNGFGKVRGLPPLRHIVIVYKLYVVYVNHEYM